MEAVGAGDLSREEILKILEQRRLYIQDIHQLANAELVRVYRTFALPLSRRPQRHKHLPHYSQQKVDECPVVQVNEDQMLMVRTANTEKCLMDVDLPLGIGEENNVIMRPITISKLIGEKRRQTDEDLVDDYQYHLTTATKRIRINAFS